MDVKTVPVKMSAKQASLLLEAIHSGASDSYPVDDWNQLQDIVRQIETVSLRVSIFYGEY